MVTVEPNFVCECGLYFGTRTGPGQHSGDERPAQIGLARVQQAGSRHGPWSVGNDEALVQLESTHCVPGMLRKDLCPILATFF